MTARSTGVAFALAALSSATAQSTIVVSGGGAALQGAINAASPGDTLDVQPGIYTPVTCSIGVRITLQAGAEIRDPSTTAQALALSVNGLAANQQFLVEGGVVAGVSVTNCAGTVIANLVTFEAWSTYLPPSQIAQCSGPVVFQGATFPFLSSFSGGTLLVTSCGQVNLRSCLLPYVEVASSFVALQDSTIRPSGVPGPGLRVVSGDVAVQGGLITGVAFLSMAIAAPAVRIDQGRLVASRGAVLQAYQPGITSATGVLANGGTIRLDPSVAVLGTPPITGPAPVVHASVPGGSAAHTATALTVVVHAEPGSAAFTFAGLATPAYATPWGTAWLLPTDPILNAAVVPASGVVSFTQGFATVPPYVVLTLQTVALSPAGVLSIGTPDRFAWN